MYHLPSYEEVSDTSSPQKLLNYTRKLYHNELRVTIENKGKGIKVRTSKVETEKVYSCKIVYNNYIIVNYYVTELFIGEK